MDNIWKGTKQAHKHTPDLYYKRAMSDHRHFVHGALWLIYWRDYSDFFTFCYYFAVKTDIEDLKSCSEAVGNPCDNGGTCTDGENGVSCLCQGDWRGRTCSTCKFCLLSTASVYSEIFILWPLPELKICHDIEVIWLYTIKYIDPKLLPEKKYSRVSRYATDPFLSRNPKLGYFC